jgi:hypothetical protein
MSMFYETCIACEEDIMFINNFDKIYSFEEDLWLNFVGYKNSNVAMNASFDEFMNNSYKSVSVSMPSTPSYFSEQTKSKKNKFQVSKMPQSQSTLNKNKVKISYFKDFSVKFTKRENIDKKVLRKFRKFLKDNHKKNQIFNLIQNFGKVFWNKFICDNLLPPMKFGEVEYKSFNTNYMVWLMSNKGAVELYEEFIKENFDSIIGMFTQKFNLKDDNDELQQLKYYVKNMANIFSNASGNGANDCTGSVIESNTFPMVEESINEEIPAVIATETATHANNTYSEVNFNYFEGNDFDNSPVITQNNNFDIFDANTFNNKGSAMFNDNCFENEDLGKMFKNSFDDGYIFCDE